MEPATFNPSIVAQLHRTTSRAFNASEHVGKGSAESSSLYQVESLPGTSALMSAFTSSPVVSTSSSAHTKTLSSTPSGTAPGLSDSCPHNSFRPATASSHSVAASSPGAGRPEWWKQFCIVSFVTVVYSSAQHLHSTK